MSMISSLIDRLRRAAQTYRNLGNHTAEDMFLEAADTIWQLRDDLQRANAENAKLRGWWTHDGTWHVELPKLPDGIAVTMPDERDRETRTARVWHYEPVRTCRPIKEHVGRSGQAHRLVCSECHHVVYDGWQDKPRYCAFCGARMEEE